jgi:hypothetical protein
MTRRIYENAEEAKKGNVKKSLERLLKAYKENPEFKQKCLENSKRIYQIKKQEFKNHLIEFNNMKAQLQAYQNPEPMID